MVSEKTTANIRRFVCEQLRDEPDLSTLTLGILRKRYLALVGQDSLSPEARNYMKQVVKEELMKMQSNDESGGGEQETKQPQVKRKRERENDEVKSESEGEDESRAKKSRRQSCSSSESEHNKESAAEDQVKSGSEDDEPEVKTSQGKTTGKHKQQPNCEKSSYEELTMSRKKGIGNNSNDSSTEMEKKKNTTKKGETSGNSPSPENKNTQTDEENENDPDRKSDNGDKSNSNDSTDDNEIEERNPIGGKQNNSDSDSSSLPSLEDDQNTGTRKKQDNKKKKPTKKEEGNISKKDDNKTVVRLKRYISLCGVKRNYKKLLDGCRSVRSMVAVLKKELEELGVHGQPSIQKCKSIRKKREEAQELAELDVGNIIATHGRPKRRGAFARQEQHDAPSSTYQRSLNLGSDSDQEDNTQKVQRRTNWANLRGIISDDADSD